MDVWALGCILFELVFQRKAFKDDFFVVDSCRRQTLSIPVPETVSIRYSESEVSQIALPSAVIVKEVVFSALSLEPRERPTAEGFRGICEAAHYWILSNTSPARSEVISRLKGISKGSLFGNDQVLILLGPDQEFEELNAHGCCDPSEMHVDGVITNISQTRMITYSTHGYGHDAILVWDAATGTLLSQFHRAVRNTNRVVYPAFSVQGSEIVSFSDSNEIIITDSTTCRPETAILRQQFHVPVECRVVAIALYGQTVAVILLRRNFRLLSVNGEDLSVSTLPCLVVLSAFLEMDSNVDIVRSAFSQDGATLFVVMSACPALHIKVYDVRLRRMIKDTKVEIGPALRSLRILGTIRDGPDVQMVLAFVCSESRRKFGLVGSRTEFIRHEVLTVSRTATIGLIFTSNSTQDIHSTTVKSGKIMRIVCGDVPGSGFTLVEWDLGTKRWQVVGALEGIVSEDQMASGKLAGILLPGQDRVNCVNSYGHSYFYNIVPWKTTE